jgi:hypothetical protein
MKNHQHTECEHQLEHCPKCDVVQCSKCNKEWRQAINLPYINDLIPKNPLAPYNNPNMVLCNSQTLYPATTIAAPDVPNPHQITCTNK